MCVGVRAEMEMRAKIEKVADIKRINAQMMGYRSEISKYEETLKEYRLYKAFLEALTPKVGHWRAVRIARVRGNIRPVTGPRLSVDEIRYCGRNSRPTPGLG